MKVGLITPGWPGHKTPNGIATSVYHLAMGLQANGHQPVIITSQIDASPPEGIPVETFKSRPWGLMHKIRLRLGAQRVASGLLEQGRADAVAEAANKHGLDVVISEETYGYANALIDRQIAPVAVFLHGPALLFDGMYTGQEALDFEWRRLAEAKLFQRAQMLLSPSQAVLSAVEESVDIKKVPRTVIPNAYDPGPKTEHPKQGQILFVGRYDPVKGGDVVLDAFEHLAQRHPDTKLTFAGPNKGVLLKNGSTQSIDEKLATLSKVARDRVHYLGTQTTNEVAGLRQNHSIALIASRFENFSYSMLEAMAASQAIVATKVGGLGEALEDGKTALLVPPEDPEAMANALEHLVQDPALAQTLGKAARQKLETDFAPQAIAARIVQFLEKTL